MIGAVAASAVIGLTVQLLDLPSEAMSICTRKSKT